MAKAAKKKTKAKSPSRLAGVMEGPAGKRVALGVLAVGVVAVLGGAGVVGVRELDRRAEKILAERIVGVDVAWPALAGADVGTTWMPPGEQTRLLAICRDAMAGGSPLGVEPLREIGRAMATTGWFRSTPRVERTGDGRLLVTGEWRRPAAVVRMGGGAGERERLVAWDSVPLPLEYAAGESGVRYLLNPKVASVPPVGRAAEHLAWPSDDVRQGLRLLSLLDDDPQVFAQVAGIDLNRGGAMVIITDRNARIRWGAGPDVFKPGEERTEIKLERLRALFERSGRIDGGVRLIEIDGPQVLLERAAP
jgi:hypothetical protein